MPKEYTKEELWELYEKLPKDLQDVIFSEETADKIWNICQRNEIKEGMISTVADYVGQVLLGILPPDQFQKILEEKIKLKKEVAKMVFHEIYRFIFAPVKERLAELYKTEIVPAKSKSLEEIFSSEIRPSLAEEKPKTPPKPDIYREQIE